MPFACNFAAIAVPHIYTLEESIGTGTLVIKNNESDLVIACFCSLPLHEARKQRQEKSNITLNTMIKL